MDVSEIGHKMMYFSIFFFLLIGISTDSLAQNSSKKIKAEADLFFEKQKYRQALFYYLEYQKYKSGDKNIILNTAICSFYANEISEAQKYLNFLIENEKGISPKTYLYLGKCAHAQLNFKEAVKQYKFYLAKAKLEVSDRRTVRDAIRRCGVGLRLGNTNTSAFVENMGDKVNAVNDDFAPHISPNYEDKIYFSSERIGNLGGLRDDAGLRDAKFGSYASDMFYTKIVNGAWAATTPLSTLLNTPRHDVILGFNETGSVLYFFKGFNTYSGEIFIDTFKNAEERSLFPGQFESEMNAALGDGRPAFVNDSILIFDSRRKGGYGGSDLYYSIKQADGWTAAKNLGSVVNSAYDETTPFLAADGFTLYFSSNNSRSSIGGMDIFQTTYNKEINQWTKPKNLGIPINSSADDLHFSLSKDGLKAYLSSDRKESIGGSDLYIAYFKEAQDVQQKPSTHPHFFTDLDQKAINIPSKQDDIWTEEVSNNNDEPLKDVTLSALYYKEDSDILAQKNIDKLNELIRLLQKYPSLNAILASNSDDTGPTQFNLFFSIKRAEIAAGYLINNGISANRITVKGLGNNYPVAQNIVDGADNQMGRQLNRRIDLLVTNSEELPIKISSEIPQVSRFIVDKKGEYYRTTTNGLSYKIQIAAIQQMYNGGLINEYPDGMVERNLSSPFYQYTLGLYRTYSSADQLQKELNRNGYMDTFIVPYIGGKRVSVDESRIYTAIYPDLINFIQEKE